MTKPLIQAKQYLKSPLNYIGGKYKILGQILPLFPKETQVFIDLFCGGCNVAMNRESPQIICNDNLSYLIQLYKFLQQNKLDSILNEIEQIIELYQLNMQNTVGYNTLRNAYNSHKEPLLLLTLIAFSFNHQIRFNNSHQFNNPFGKNRSSFNPNMKRNLIYFIQNLQSKNIEFFNYDFRDFIESHHFTNETFIYADPPYLITQGTYNDGKRGFSGWNEVLEKDLLESLYKLDSKGVKFALSNVLKHKNKENIILKQWVDSNSYIITPIYHHYTNSNYQVKCRDKNQTQEVLITNYQPNKVYLP
ncbi:DNA adenine methylase [Helicobacter didelphidarum]|uniref:Site-specific DNA-methyltransferase (adenine-specific) n=1 Tax=Helicobacter didelphidarum TaxID=2040648 RepID=A0A3D8IJ34_9HELI|nr:DNA adenine methylase [Helicobacter didelphidarum]RDU64955.1 DNA adenine methylase [Helicobacter didelphidarum]